MSYDLFFGLDSFDRMPIEQARVVVATLVDALSLVDAEYLRQNPGTRGLYQSTDIRYAPDTRIEQQWWDIPRIITEGRADCKGFAAWRIAELLSRGIDARPYVTYSPGTGFHVQVAYRGRIEDPSRVKKNGV